MNGRRAYVAILCFVALVAPTARGQFSILETEHIKLLTYTKQHEFIAEHAARCFENAMQFHRRVFDYTPSEKVTVILQDFGDFASGGANTVPYNLVGIGIAPFSYTYETMPPIERMTMMANHELAHIVTMDKPSPSNATWRSLFFGKVAPIDENPLSMLYAHLTSPRWNSPRWFIEGSAVFMETWMNGGLGRALGAYDEMVFRTMVRDGSYFYDVVGLEAEATKVDFQVGAASYLYGTRFISYLGLVYGPEKLLAWFAQSDSSRNTFRGQFELIYGASLDEEWSRWIAWEKRWQQSNLEAVRANPVTPFRPLTPEGVGSVSRAFYDESLGKLFAAINYPGQTAHIVALDITSGKVDRLQHIRGGALFYVSSLAYDRAGKKLFYTTDNNHERDLNVLDIAEGRSRMLIQNFRTGDLAFNRADSSLWGVRHLNGLSTIVRLAHPYGEGDWEEMFVWDYGKDVFDLDVSPDGRLLTAALAELDGRQLLIAMSTEDLRHGKTDYDVLFDFDISTPATFTFSDDGRYLYGSTYYSGVSNIIRYDLERRDPVFLTNTESGFFRPVPYSADSLIVFHYTGKGFVPAVIAIEPVERFLAIRYLGNEVVKTHPELEGWTLPPPSPSRINLDSLTVRSGPYAPFSGFRLASLYPVVEGYKEFPSYGVRLNFSDPLVIHRMDVSLSYSPNQLLPEKERIHGLFNYSFWNWKIGLGYNRADFYDLFGPTKVSRKGLAAGLQYRGYLTFDEPETMSYRIGLNGYWRLERLPDYQAVSVAYDRFYSLNLELNYEYLERSLGAVEDEMGIAWDLVSPTNLIRGDFFPRIIGSFSLGFLLPINHSSVWLRASAGKAFGPRDESLANFYFGGFGNNWVDHGDIWQYRYASSFPGLPVDRQDELGGTNYGKLTVEWNLPPVRFRRFGVADLYCNWTRLTLFSSGIVTNMDLPDADFRKKASGNAGAQIDFRLVLFSSLQSTFSMGYAAAMAEGARWSNEFMISLKIL